MALLTRVYMIVVLALFSLWSSADSAKVALVIHGGAGTIKRQEMAPEREKQYLDALRYALRTGHSILKNGGRSLDAVEAVIRFMEDSPLFNAGKGAVLNADGKVELDAAIMDGKTMMAGAVAAVTTIKNPIAAARKVMEKSPHVMLIGGGAEKFAAEAGLEIVDPSYFFTERRHQELLKEKQKEREKQQQENHGTVGAVALDANGDLAAGTSTGGRTNKRYGRVGDSPIIGAGTYAKNKVCAVSGTGHGEYFIRTVAAHNICSLMEHKGLDPQSAAEEVLNQIKNLGGDGGVIVMDSQGRYAMSFNTSGMYRGVIDAEGAIDVQIFKLEK